MVDYYHARALIGMQRRAEAIPLLQKAIQVMPDFVEALVELAYAYEQQKQWNEARSVYEKLLRLQVSEQDVCLRLVHLSLRLNQPEKALKYFRKGPDSAAFKLTAVSMFLESRHYLQAERLLQEMLDKPAVPPDVFLLSLIHILAVGRDGLLILTVEHGFHGDHAHGLGEFIDHPALDDQYLAHFFIVHIILAHVLHCQQGNIFGSGRRPLDRGQGALMPACLLYTS